MRENNGHTYLAIDLKSYYASVEAADRHLDPLTTNLVVADSSRTEKTICLAVSPSLKAHGISGRARLFEVVQRVKEVNQERFQKAKRLGKLPKDEDGNYHFTSASFDAEALAADSALELSYIVAPPRKKLYEKNRTQIFSTYIPYSLLHLRRMQRSKRKHSTRFFSLCCYYANRDGVNRAAFRGTRSIHAISGTVHCSPSHYRTAI